MITFPYLYILLFYFDFLIRVIYFLDFISGLSVRYGNEENELRCLLKILYKFKLLDLWVNIK